MALCLRACFLKMKSSWFYVLVYFLLLTSCTERMICPAYQSAFIHDKEAQRRHFSYFKEDSTPKIVDIEKDQFLIIKPIPYKKKVRMMNTVAMVDVYPVLDDSLEFDQDDLMLAERDVIDSAAVEAADSVSIHPGLIGPFNTDQELYMYYLRKTLVLPDARADMMEAEKRNKERQKEQKKLEKKEKKKGGGIFSIFKKKKEEEQKEPEEEEVPIIFDEEEDNQDEKTEEEESDEDDDF